MSHILHLGDCLDTMLFEIASNSVDAIVTDPPYGLSFMGKKWDYDVPSVEVWAECLRVLKPGGHLLAFAGTRTQHRMAVRIEDAGFEIRDMIAWVYGSGFPKSLDVSKAIDKAGGTVIGLARSGVLREATTDTAARWQGWGTALKPALEPITVARKPLGEKTVAANVLAHGTGALNIDGCRVGSTKNVPASVSRKAQANCYGRFAESGETQGVGGHDPNLGRWPANLIHDGSDEVLQQFPDSAGSGAARTLKRGKRDGEGWGMADEPGQLRDAGAGSAARFFYCAKASKSDRGADNNHPTVKPTDLMRYLCRLVTPPGGVVLDPFMGSGSTGKAAVAEGFRFIGIERDEHYFEVARSRIEGVKP